jgi:uncharacterized protein (DUF2249 family)
MALAVVEFQSTLTELSLRAIAVLDRILTALGRLSDSEALSFITDAYPAALLPFLSASTELTTQWYDEQPTDPVRRGAAAFVAEPVDLASSEQLAISARWAATQLDSATALKGNATRNVFNTSRETVWDNCAREGSRYVRHARPDACGFCRLLATRTVTSTDEYGATGSLYGSKSNAEQTPHRDGKRLQAKGHDSCRCVGVPVRGVKRDYDWTRDAPYLAQWTADYYAAQKRADKAGTGADFASLAKALDDPNRRKAKDIEA